MFTGSAIESLSGAAGPVAIASALPAMVSRTALAVVFLASSATSHIHGVLLPVDGGRLAV